MVMVVYKIFQKRYNYQKKALKILNICQSQDHKKYKNNKVGQIYRFMDNHSNSLLEPII